MAWSAEAEVGMTAVSGFVRFWHPLADRAAHPAQSASAIRHCERLKVMSTRVRRATIDCLAMIHFDHQQSGGLHKMNHYYHLHVHSYRRGRTDA
jgi:hypothetical protein